MICKTRFQEVLKDTVEEHVRCIQSNTSVEVSVHHINNGYCTDFAHSVWEKFNRSDEIRTVSDEEMCGEEYSHTFIEFQGMYYDAECIEGVEDWTQLPIFLDENRVVVWY